MSLKPTFRPVLLVFFRLLKCYQNGGSFCCDVQLCNCTRRIVIITRRANDVKMRGKINFPAHFNIVCTSCNDHDTSCAVTKLNVTTKRSAILITF